jgi:tetratricopeptide (TPR) repeat protein
VRDRGAFRATLPHAGAARVEGQAREPRERALEPGSRAAAAGSAYASSRGSRSRRASPARARSTSTRRRRSSAASSRALAALHEKRIAHGGVKLENVIVGRGAGGNPARRARRLRQRSARLRRGSPWTASPRAQGREPRAAARQARRRGRAICTAFGALLFEILTGKPVFAGESGVDVAIAHPLADAPRAEHAGPARLGARRSSTSSSASSSHKTAGGRPKDIAARARRARRDRQAAKDDEARRSISDEDLNDQASTSSSPIPGDASERDGAGGHHRAGGRSREASARPSARCRRRRAGRERGDKIKAGGQEAAPLPRRPHLRVPRQGSGEGRERLRDDRSSSTPRTTSRFTGLEDARRALGKHEELIEMLLEPQPEAREPHRARPRPEPDRPPLPASELEDKEQAAFAFARPSRQETKNDEYAADLERAAGSDMKLWAEALQILSEVTTHPNMPRRRRSPSSRGSASWYSEKIARPDMGLPCFQAVLSVDPANDGALEGVAQVYRRAQQWQRARAGAPLPRGSRAHARPGPRPPRRGRRAPTAPSSTTRPRAAISTSRSSRRTPATRRPARPSPDIYRGKEDWSGLAKILEKEADALRGERKVETICRIAELYEDQLNDLVEATRRYEAALELDPMSLTALKGLDRIYNRTGRYKELLENLERRSTSRPPRARRSTSTSAWPASTRRSSSTTPRPPRRSRPSSHIDAAHEGALTGLVRHYRASAAGRTSSASTSGTSPSSRRTSAAWSCSSPWAACSWTRSAPRSARARRTRRSSRSTRTTAAPSRPSRTCAPPPATPSRPSPRRVARREGDHPESKADLWLQAAKILEGGGDRDGAIERYKKALDAQPTNAVATTAAARRLPRARRRHERRRAHQPKTIDVTDGNLAKARLYGEMAQLLRDKIRDDERAEKAATKAVDLDPTNMNGLLISGDLAFEAARFIEASKSYESIANRVDALPKEQQPKLLMRYVDALSKSGGTEKAARRPWRSSSPSRPTIRTPSRAPRRSTSTPARARRPRALYQDLLKRFGDRSRINERGDVDAQASARPGSRPAIRWRRSSRSTRPRIYAPEPRPHQRPLQGLRGEEGLRRGRAPQDAPPRRGERRRAQQPAPGDRRHPRQPDERPHARGQELRRRARRAPGRPQDPHQADAALQRGEGLGEAHRGRDQARQQGRRQEAEGEVPPHRRDRQREAAPGLRAGLQVLRRGPRRSTRTSRRRRPSSWRSASSAGDHEGLERALKRRAREGQRDGRHGEDAPALRPLGALYKDKLGKIAEAVDAYEAAQSLDPDNETRNELLAEIYLGNQEQFLEKAVATRIGNVRKNPYKPESYKLLRKVLHREQARRRRLLPLPGPLLHERWPSPTRSASSAACARRRRRRAGPDG